VYSRGKEDDVGGACTEGGTAAESRKQTPDATPIARPSPARASNKSSSPRLARIEDEEELVRAGRNFPNTL
jgi:hypothetical protein